MKKKLDLAKVLFGEESEQFCAHMEEIIMFYAQCQSFGEVALQAKRFIQIQAKVYGGENNEKVLMMYELLANHSLQTGALVDGLMY